jgi:hypothetical protein
MKAMTVLQKVLDMTGEVKGQVDFAKMIDQRFLPPGTSQYK